MPDRRKTKRIFLIICTLFMTALLYASYDISSRTTFPGSKPQLKERIKQTYLNNDSLDTPVDSLAVDQTENE